MMNYHNKTVLLIDEGTCLSLLSFMSLIQLLSFENSQLELELPSEIGKKNLQWKSQRYTCNPVRAFWNT